MKFEVEDIDKFESLQVEIIWKKKQRLYKCLEPFVLAGEKISNGFVSDGPSIPRIVWWALPETEHYLSASFVHDQSLILGYGWKKSNKLMRQAMKESGVTKFDRILVSTGIEIGKYMDYLKKYTGIGGRYV